MYALVCVCVRVCVWRERGHRHRNAMEPSPSSCASRFAGPTAPAAMCGLTEPPTLHQILRCTLLYDASHTWNDSHTSATLVSCQYVYYRQFNESNVGQIRSFLAAVLCCWYRFSRRPRAKLRCLSQVTAALPLDTRHGKLKAKLVTVCVCTLLSSLHLHHFWVLKLHHFNTGALRGTGHWNQHSSISRSKMASLILNIWYFNNFAQNLLHSIREILKIISIMIIGFRHLLEQWKLF